MELLRPRRPDHARILASLADAPSPAVAWRALVERGALPASWLDDPRRRFVHDPGDRICTDLPTRDPARAPAYAWPSSIEECALFASDVAGVEAAERAAQEFVARLAPWGAPPFHHVLWWTLPREHCAYVRTDTRPGVCYALPFAVNAVFDNAPARLRDSLLAYGDDARRWAELWLELAAAGARVPHDNHIAAVRGRGLADLPNPFEPLAIIEAAGYATLEWVGSDGPSRGAAVLVMPRA